MGNCLLGKNKVGSVDNIIAKKRSSCNRKATKSIKDGERRMLQELKDQQPSVRRGGLSFVVQFNSKITPRPPRRLQKLEGRPALELNIEQLDEKQMKADLLRLEKKDDIQLRARQEQQRCQSAMKRREAKSEEMKAKLEAKRRENEKKIEERRRKLTKLAQKTKEAKQRKAKNAV